MSKEPLALGRCCANADLHLSKKHMYLYIIMVAGNGQYANLLDTTKLHTCTGPLRKKSPLKQTDIQTVQACSLTLRMQKQLPAYLPACLSMP